MEPRRENNDEPWTWMKRIRSSLLTRNVWIDRLNVWTHFLHSSTTPASSRNSTSGKSSDPLTDMMRILNKQADLIGLLLQKNESLREFVKQQDLLTEYHVWSDNVGTPRSRSAEARPKS